MANDPFLAFSEIRRAKRKQHFGKWLNVGKWFIILVTLYILIQMFLPMEPMTDHEFLRYEESRDTNFAPVAVEQ